jgi:cation diffusion facilitator family transporter
MSDCGCHLEAQTAAERRTLRVALVLNATMAVLGALAAWWAHSSGLLADALDMLSDATAYAIGLAALGRSGLFKRRAAGLSGAVLAALGVGVLIEVGRRFLHGAEPVGGWMIATAGVSLAVNLYVLRSLAAFRTGEVHLRASWIFTRADVVANVGVLLAGVLVTLTGSATPDLVIGALIGLYILKEAIEILRQATSTAAAPTPGENGG